MWAHTGRKRPPFAVTPGPGQESVWDYPRPPALSPDERLIEVYHADTVVASSRAAYRVLETASPPSFYIPPQDVRMDLLLPKPGFSTCEWKGRATYWVLGSDPKIGKVGWSYGDPRPGFRAVRNYLSFYPTVLSCFVDGERVRGQSGGYYGGWITGDIVGPFKGDRGTGHW